MFGEANSLYVESGVWALGAIIVLLLIFWLIKKIFSGGATRMRGTQPRLAVIDAAVVDDKRRLVLVRRDNVEHLVMIGGPSDVVIEPGIAITAPANTAHSDQPASVAAQKVPEQNTGTAATTALAAGGAAAGVAAAVTASAVQASTQNTASAVEQTTANAVQTTDETLAKAGETVTNLVNNAQEAALPNDLPSDAEAASAAIKETVAPAPGPVESVEVATAPQSASVEVAPAEQAEIAQALAVEPPENGETPTNGSGAAQVTAQTEVETPSDPGEVVESETAENVQRLMDDLAAEAQGPTQGPS